MRIVLAGVCAVLVGCVATEPELGSKESEVETPNRLSSNALSANRLSSNRLSSNGLAAATTTLTELADNGEGRELLTYLVSCALPAGEQITTTTSDGNSYTFAGSIGLAPAWATQAPTISERRWVSACLLARTNAFGISVKLSLRGAAPALALGDSEKSSYTEFEGGFFGDLWAPDPRPMNTCESALSATDPTSSTFALRKCSDSTDEGPNPCGFTWVGMCQRVCDKTTCMVGGTAWVETIFVYLQRG